ncbi:SDR family oxidoreductase [Allorhizocola rhizosphaerae]|uniref:SDR family oxidoreductase n=1 Tax=Allorhizocola rhizosphaerae TaxID=1872709 RepID=UPI000E3BAB3A|nr:SDR family oxidoreductase [Allorhizocola rhizosphaerae]
MDLGLAGKAFLLTGASRGLGFATARCLVADGANVVLSARDEQRLAAAVADLGKAQAHGVPADLGEETTADRLVGAALDHFGRLDGALISVGGPPRGTATQVTDEQWRESFETVFLGAVRLARRVAEALTNGGAIGFVLSSSAWMPIVGLGLSNGLRPGLLGVAKDMADELAPRGIRVVSLLPHRILTDRNRELFAATGDAAKAQSEAEASIPLGRLGQPEEFGRVAAFLLSPAASYLTGLAVPVDGGAMRAY